VVLPTPPLWLATVMIMRHLLYVHTYVRTY
jgi:hypothetical protein